MEKLRSNIKNIKGASMRNFFYMSLIFSLTLLPLNCSVSQDLADIQEAILIFKETSYYFSTMLQFYATLGTISQKFTNIPSINCKSCLRRSLLCDELIVKVQTKCIEKSIKSDDGTVDMIRKKMLSIYHEVTQLLSTGSQDAIKKFMEKTSQEEEIPCEACKRVVWKADVENKMNSNCGL